MASKSLTFLPTIFQTDANEKFLAATVDQLIAEPKLTKMYGYVGRTFAPTYKTGDSYIQEPSVQRQNYQLEPSVVVNDISGNTTFYASYPDLLNQISYYGGFVNDQSRLFDSQYYSFDPLIDFDKFVNFGQYYWLPNGPDAVSVFTGTVPFQQTFIVTRNSNNSTYEFTSDGILNPSITLAIGGTYHFDVSQVGNDFWIQSELGLRGVLRESPNISSRSVFGVVNNGIDDGTIVFTVPQQSAQRRFTQMPLQYSVDFTTSLPYSEIQGSLLSEFVATYGGFDGMTSQLDGKQLVFIDQNLLVNLPSYSATNPYDYEVAWTEKGAYITEVWDATPWEGISDPWDMAQFNAGYVTVPDDQRVAVWQIKLIPSSNVLTFSGNITANEGDVIVQTATGASAIVIKSVTNENTVKVAYTNAQIFRPAVGTIRVNDISLIVYPITSPDNDYIISLSNTDDHAIVRVIDLNNKVFVKSGMSNVNKTYYVDYDGLLKEQPLITSPLHTLYYQDGTSADIYGAIKLVENQNWSIDVANDILGKINYTSPNGVVFTNGLKIQFAADVTVGYQNAQYYIEGVGTAITLTPVELLVTPEEYNTKLSMAYNGEIFPDYITINRGSLDLNPWSRNNRWFHKDIIELTNHYNTPTQPIIFEQQLRALRPILEYNANLQLLNNGKIGKKYVDIIDTTTIDSFNSVQGQNINTIYGIQLVDNMRIIFAVDQDPTVRNNIYLINFIYTATDEFGTRLGYPQINLVKSSDSIVRESDCVVVLQGNFAGSNWWFNGLDWVQSQQKTRLQQPPMFDIFDADGNSLASYPNSTFTGTQIFGYMISSAGVTDPVLGIALSYRSFSTQGEIAFRNFFDSDSFTYLSNGLTISSPVNSGFLHQTIDYNNSLEKNVWATVIENSHQYQIISYTYAGDSVFELPIAPLQSTNSIPYLKIYHNSSYLSHSAWSYTAPDVTVLTPLVIGDIIDIMVYSDTVYNTDTFQVPLNLDFNAMNQDFDSMTLGQMRNHVVQLTQNSNIVKGRSIGSNNLRDIQYKNQGGNILKNSAPLTYSELFLIDDSKNFINAVRLAQREYSKFKNKFLELSATLSGVDGTQPATSVDLIMNTINSFKNSSFSWYYSDMVPYNNDNTNVLTVNVFNPFVRTYELTNIFDDATLSNKSVLVYLDADPSATFILGTGINVDFDINNKLQYETSSGILFVNGQTIRFGAQVMPTWYQNNSYEIRGVGSSITLVPVNNNVQLLKGRDYTFSKTLPAIVINDNVKLDVGYIITIVEYSNTDGNYIPETPTKLGLYPKFMPQIIMDTTYFAPINVIIGHDGSKTPAFNDYRDTLLLELESRIYNNIKVDNATTNFSLYDVLPGKFRKSDYVLNEFDSILTANFLTWVGDNSIDYSTNSTFLPNDAFSWNYAAYSDSVDGTKLQGSWRAIYKYFYDTDTPNTTPWEMLGFSEQPEWWVSYYGAAPYTGSNQLLWDDLSNGLIKSGNRQGIDDRFIRPNLLKIIPVDDNGFLRSPVEFLTVSFNGGYASSAWSIGNHGPAETAWRRSSDYPFAMQMSMALTKPARYFGTMLNIQNYKFNNSLNQYLVTTTNNHLKQSDIVVNGTTTNLLINRASGYLNWIADYLVNQGVNATNLTTMLTDFTVKLSYKVAGFTDANFLQILAEQYSPTSTNDSIIIPDENYTVALNKSTPLQKIVYSGVIITKTNSGYTVRGYDLTNPHFVIIPSVQNNNGTKVNVLNSSAVIYSNFQELLVTVPYGYEFKTQQQVVDFLISYERYLLALGFAFSDFNSDLGQVQNWTLSAQEFLFWAQQGWHPNSVLVLSPISNSLNIVTNGAIVDAIVDNSNGSRVLDQNFNMVRNIEYSVMRTPTSFNITLTNDQVIGLVVLSLVQYEHVLIFDNTTVFNEVIYQPELGNRQFRLKLIGQKTDNWDGSLSPTGFIYNSGTVDVWNQGNDYLKGAMVKFKTQYYVALVDIVASDEFDFTKWRNFNYSSMKTGLLPNWSSIAAWPLTYYNNYNELVDSNSASYQGGQNSNQSHYGYGLIGFRRRPYMDELGVTDTSQVDLYKGMIAQKGTANAVNALLSAQFGDLGGAINFYEEWAVRVGEYGALQTNRFVEVTMDESAFTSSLQVMEFVDVADQYLSNGTTIFGQSNLYDYVSPTVDFGGNIALNRTKYSDYSNDIPYAGFVNINDVNTTIFDFSTYSNLDVNISAIGSGYTIWCAKDFNLTWNVFRVTETDNVVTSVTDALNGYISVTTRNPHKLSVSNAIMIKDFSTVIDGFYQVITVINVTTFLVQYQGVMTNFTTATGNALLYTLDSLKFDYMEDVRLYTPPNGWREGEKVWVQNTAPNGGWTTYERTTPWSYDYALTKATSENQANDGFGSSVKMSDDENIIVVGSPLNTVFGSNGIVDVFVKNYAGKIVHSTVIVPASPLTTGFGHAVDIVNNIIVIGAPTSENNTGHVYLYYKDPDGPDYKPLQILRGSSADQFGTEVSFSRDGLWLYITAVGNDKIYAYAFDAKSLQFNTIANIGQLTTAPYSIPLPHDTGIDDTNELVITGQGICYVPGSDFTLIGNVISFVVALHLTGIVTVIAGDVISQASSSAAAVVYSSAITSSVIYVTYTQSIDFDYFGSVISINGITSTVTVSSIVTPLPTSLTTVAIQSYTGYALLDILTHGVNGQFGAAIGVSSDGSQIAIGAPLANVMLQGTSLASAGVVYVYDRTIESMHSDGMSIIFPTNNTIKKVCRVVVDGTIMSSDIDYIAQVGSNQVTFILPPRIGSVVTIETNTFNILQILQGSDPQVGAKFGTSLRICSFNCAIYVGAPGYDVDTGFHSLPADESIIPNVNKGIIVDGGGVFKHHNQGRLYGTIAGTKIAPTVTMGNSIRLNDFEVVFTGTSLQTVVDDINNQHILGISAVVEAIVITQIYFLNESNGNWYDAATSMVTDVTTLALLQSSGLTQFNLVGGIYTAISGIWYNATQNTIVDLAFINLLNAQSYLRIFSESTVSRNLLRVLSGTGTGVDDLGLAVFVQMQIITSPNNIAGEQFGSTLALNTAAHGLVISGSSGNTLEATTFDLHLLTPTTFDSDSLRFIDTIEASGSAYLFELYDDPRGIVATPGRYAYTQQFDSGTLSSGYKFGTATDIVNNFVVITAPNSNDEISNGGSIYLFANSTGGVGWKNISQQAEKVDINSVSRLYLYDSVTHTIIQNIQTIDPIKGKILGQAEQEITYKTSIDPAIYNTGNKYSVTTSNNRYWDVTQSYQVWWNLDAVRYMDYEQDTLTYRNLNWGRPFPGSVIQICEWTPSTVVPSQYTGDGNPLYPDDSAYCQVTTVDSTLGTISTVYYFWVTNKQNLSVVNSYRTLTTSTIAAMIENPLSQNIPYAAVLRNNAISFYNISGFLSGTTVILHIDYAASMEHENIIHSEYELVQNGPTGSIPARIMNKFIDSLSGIDVLGQTVPDPLLPLSQRYGLNIRPRQTMFVDRYNALSQVISYINTILNQYDMRNLVKYTQLNAQSPLPSINSGTWDESVLSYEELQYLEIQNYAVGHRILVERDMTQDGLWIIYSKTVGNQWQIQQVQPYNTNQYWSTTDWYSAGYDSLTTIKYIVPTMVDALKLSYAVGDIIKVINDGDGNWAIIEITNNNGVGGLTTIAAQNGTIIIDAALSDYIGSNLGFDNQGFGDLRFSQDPSIEVRYILQSFLLHLPMQFDSEFKLSMNTLFFLMLNYIHTEQPHVDWAFKSSFVTVFHQLKALLQAPVFYNDNTTYYQDYIDEVKPYRTKVREYVVDYTGTDSFLGTMTDFDLPAYYDRQTHTFRSPSGEYPAIDEQTWQLPPFNEWYNNRTYSIGRIVVDNGGVNYTEIPTITILSTVGSGATAHAVINADTGAITRIVVDTAGSGYSSTVQIIINGNGSGALAHAEFAPSVIRSLATTIKFDRVNYDTIVNGWTANTTYWLGDILTINGSSYTVTSNVYAAGTVVDYTSLTPFAANAFVTANDRITGYYTPASDMPVIDNISQDIITANATVNSDTIYLKSVTGLRYNMVLSGDNCISSRITQIVANVAAGTNYITVDRPQTLSNSAVITATYTNLGQLVSGVEYSGIQVTGALFSESPGFDSGANFGESLFDVVSYEDGVAILGDGQIDTTIRSDYLDSLLGTRPEDITVDGGAYYDSYNSHSPEELVPGIIYDTLDMKIYTKVGSNTLGYRIFNNMAADTTYMRLSGMNITSLVADLSLNDTYIFVEDGTVLSPPDISLARPGVIFIGGERITYYRNYALEVTQWLPSVTFDTDSIVSFGKLVTFSGNLTIDPGDYIVQPSSGAVAMVTVAAVNTNNVYLYYTTTTTFTLGSGAVQIIGAGDDTIGANTYPMTSDTGYYITTAPMLSSTFDYTSAVPLANNNVNILSQLRRGTQGTGAAAVHTIGSPVVDAGTAQIIPESKPFIGNTGALTDHSWYATGIGTATNGLGLGGGLSSTWTLQETFLWTSPYQ